ncbi:MAG: DUF1275 family protein [Planctomycetes bacterium]|nr:DUF1275 family protein [Planctomycetota bacterium]
MFRGQAHSFQQQARLAISLSWVAGYTNALTVLTCGQVTSHLSGTVSQFGVEVAEVHWSRAGYLACLALMFLAGAFTAGALTEFGRMRRFQSIYVLPMAVEALLLAGFAVLIDWQALGRIDGADARVWLTFLPSFAMGLQNATITRISGGVVRTTHVTGVVTDLGLELARLLFRSFGWPRRLDPVRATQARWRVLLLLSIPGSFALGAGLGTVAFDFFEAWSMAPAVAFLALLTLQDILVPIAAVELRSGVHGGAPIIAVFHAERPAGSKRFRMPDLTSWAASIDEHVRVVVLDLADVHDMGERSAHELRALMLHLREEGRVLVLAGVGKPQLAVLHHAGVLLDFDADDLCGDLHSAALRAEQIAAR